MPEKAHYFAKIFVKLSKIQAGFISWNGGTLAANMFATLNCDFGGNLAHFCNRRLDRDVKALSHEQAIHPAAAAARAAQIDREFVRAAPWVPLMTPLVADLTSARVGNFQVNPWVGDLIDQTWVR